MRGKPFRHESFHDQEAMTTPNWKKGLFDLRQKTAFVICQSKGGGAGIQKNIKKRSVQSCDTISGLMASFSLQ